jgi:hypothetical protein
MFVATNKLRTYSGRFRTGAKWCEVDPRCCSSSSGLGCPSRGPYPSNLTLSIGGLVAPALGYYVNLSGSDLVDLSVMRNASYRMRLDSIDGPDPSNLQAHYRLTDAVDQSIGTFFRSHYDYVADGDCTGSDDVTNSYSPALQWMPDLVPPGASGSGPIIIAPAPFAFNLGCPFTGCLTVNGAPFWARPLSGANPLACNATNCEFVPEGNAPVADYLTNFSYPSAGCGYLIPQGGAFNQNVTTHIGDFPAGTPTYSLWKRCQDSSASSGPGVSTELYQDLYLTIDCFGWSFTFYTVVFVREIGQWSSVIHHQMFAETLGGPFTGTESVWDMVGHTSGAMNRVRAAFFPNAFGSGGWTTPTGYTAGPVAGAVYGNVAGTWTAGTQDAAVVTLSP